VYSAIGQLHDVSFPRLMKGGNTRNKKEMMVADKRRSAAAPKHEVCEVCHYNLCMWWDDNEYNEADATTSGDKQTTQRVLKNSLGSEIGLRTCLQRATICIKIMPTPPNHVDDTFGDTTRALLMHSLTIVRYLSGSLAATCELPYKAQSFESQSD